MLGIRRRAALARLVALCCCSSAVAAGASSTVAVAQSPESPLLPGMFRMPLSSVAMVPTLPALPGPVPELGGPEQRSGANGGFGHLDPHGAATLVLTNFLDDLPGATDNTFGDLHVRRYIDSQTALVDPPGADTTATLLSSVPLRDRDDDGDLARVDASLIAVTGGFRPVNALVDGAQLPLEIRDGASAGNGVSLSFANQPSASSAIKIAPDTLVYPNAATHTDVVLQSLATGLEAAFQLRSPDAPSSLQIRLGLPDGASLTLTGGGIEITKSDRVVATVLPPTAFDAAGNTVPASYEVAGDEITVRVDVPSDAMYPVLVDPVVQTYVPDNTHAVAGSNVSGSFGEWQAAGTQNPYFAFSDGPVGLDSYGANGRGLYAYAYPNGNYPANAYGQFTWRAPGQTTYITQAALQNIYLNRRGDTLNPATIVAGIWSTRLPWFTGFKTIAGDLTNQSLTVSPGDNVTSPDTQGGNLATFAMTVPTAWHTTQWTTAFLGGAAFTLDDPEAPTLATPGFSPALPSNPAKTLAQDVTVNATDPGLGVERFTLSGLQTGTKTYVVSCGHTAQAVCPSSASGTFHFTEADLARGPNVLSLTATDAGGRTSTSQTFTVNIDKCTKTFLPTSGYWSDASNWSGGSIPTATDRACIPAGSTTTIVSAAQPGSVTGDGTITLGGGSLSPVDSTWPSDIATLSIAGGAVAGTQPVTVTGNLSFSNGSIAAGGVVKLSSGATGELTRGTLAGTLVNNGALSILGASDQQFSGLTGAVLDNRGVLKVLKDAGYGALWVAGTQRPLLRNSGTVTKDSGTGSSWVYWPVTNSGTIKAETGALNFAGGTEGAVVDGGTWKNAGGTVGLAGGTTYPFQLGNVADFSATITSATVSATDLGATSHLSLTGGTFSAAGDPHIGSLSMTGGSVAGTGTLHVTDTVSLAGGTIATGATLQLDSGATGTVTRATIAGTLRNDGTLTALGASDEQISGQTGGTLDNRGLLKLNKEVGYSALWVAGTQTPLLRNSGTVTKDAGTGSTYVTWGVANSGTIKAESGTLRFSGGSGTTVLDGGLWRDAGGSVKLAGGTFNLGHDVRFDATLESGTVSAAGFRVTSTPKITGGTLALATEERVAALTMTGGTIAGTAPLHVTDSLIYGGGTINLGGELILDASGTGTVAGAIIAGTLTNKGTLAVTGGTWGQNSGILNNQGLLRLNSEGGVTGLYVPGTQKPLLRNTGTITKDAGTGSSFVSWLIANGGTIKAETGFLRFTGGTGVTVLDGGTWKDSGGSLRLAGGNNGFQLGNNVRFDATLESGTISAAGFNPVSAPRVVGGLLSLATEETVTSLTMTGGEFAGTQPLHVSNALLLAGGTINAGGALQLDSGGTGTISGGTVAGSLINRGSLDAAGAVFGRTGGLLDNYGTLTANVEVGYGPLYTYTPQTPLLKNSGTVIKNAGTGVSGISWKVANSGVIKATTGRFGFYYGSGGLTADNGRWLSDGGTVVLGGGATFDLGTNTDLTATVENANVGVKQLSTSGTLRMTEGAINVTGPGASTIESLAIQTGSFTKAAPTTSHHLFWSGGTIGGPDKLVSNGEAYMSGGLAFTGGEFVNNGAATLAGGWITGSGAARITNNGSFNLATDSGQSLRTTTPGPTPYFFNRGYLFRADTLGQTTINWKYGGVAPHAPESYSNPNPPHQWIFPDPNIIIATVPVAGIDSAAEDHAGGGSPADPNHVQCAIGHPVDCATGNQFEVQQDLSVGGRGPGLELVRTYNSQAAATASAPGDFGYGWSASYTEHLTIDAANQLVIVHQANGSTARFAIDNDNYVAAPWVQATLRRDQNGDYIYTRPDQLSLRFNSDGLLLAQIDRNNNQTTMAYNAYGHLSAVTDAGGRSLTIGHNPDGTVSSVTDPTGLIVHYQYDNGNLATVHYSTITGNEWEFAYDSAHQLTEMTDARGHTVSTHYDSQHRVNSQTDALNRTRTWDYSSGYTTITNPGGDVTRQVFEDGQPIEIINGYGSTTPSTKTLDYDPITKALTRVVDPEGRVTTYDYDDAGNRTAVNLPGGRTYTATYNAARDVTSTTSPSGKVATYGYDVHGNPTSVTRTLVTAQGSQAQTYSYAYDGAGNRESSTDALGHTTTYDYNGRGDLTSSTDPLGHLTTFAYDDASRLTAVTTPRGHESGADPDDFTTTIQRDVLGQPIGTTDGLGRHTSTAYDETGNVTSETDAENRTTSFGYDDANQLTTSTSPDSAATHTAYDQNGRVKSTTNANGHVTSYTRDVLGRVTQQDAPLARTTHYSYDASGRAKSTTTPEGLTTSYAYTPAGELQSVDYQDPNTHDVSYVYDADGLRLSMTDDTGTTDYAYDTLGRLTKVTDGDTQTIEYAYDLANRQTAITYPGGDQVTRTYDDGDRPHTITDWLGNTTTYNYDANNNQTTIAYPTGTANVETNTFDNADRATGQTLAHAATTQAAITNTYNTEDQLVSQVGNGDYTVNQTYGYDARGRLTTDGTTTHTYDPNSNLTNIAGTTQNYNAADQITTATRGSSSVSYGYDVNGNRTTVTPHGTTATDLTYNQADLLVEFDNHATAAISYQYDGDGLRTSKTTGTTRTRMTWDRSSELPNPIAEGTTRYVYGPDGLPLEQIDSANNVKYLHHDRLGNTRLVTNANGSTHSTYSYDSYGNRTTTSGPGDVPFGFAGQYTETDTGLVYMRARYYDPATGQFITRDPLEVQTGDAYGYASGDPANLVDPSGLCSIAPWKRNSCLSRAAANVLDGLSGGYSTKLAGAIFDFDPDCAELGTGVFHAAGFAASFAFGGGEFRAAKFSAEGAEAIGKFSPLIPRGAAGPLPTRSPGFQYLGGAGGSGLHPSVTGVRFMEETSHHAARRVYMNAEGQTVNPFTGRTVGPTDPMAHLAP